MARIVGVDVPDNKRGEFSLSHVYGIGRKLAVKILREVGVENKRVSEWNQEELQKIRAYISSNVKVEGDLRSTVKSNIKSLIDIGCYRGKRHALSLPVRGQRTKNNCRTRKGKRKTVANKKKATAK